MNQPTDTATSTKLTTRQVAERLRVARHRVLAWIASGELEAINVATNASGVRPRWRIDLAKVEEFERRRATRAPVKSQSRSRRSTSEPAYF